MSSVYVNLLPPTNAKACFVAFCHDKKLYFRVTVLFPNLRANTLTESLSGGYEMGSTGLVPAISAKSKGLEKLI